MIATTRFAVLMTAVVVIVAGVSVVPLLLEAAEAAPKNKTRSNIKTLVVHSQSKNKHA